MGNTVYFMNGPRRSGNYKAGEIIVSPTEYDGLYLLEHKLFYPVVLKHYAKFLHYLLLKIHLGNVIDKIGKVDIIWSFDVSNTLPLSLFKKKDAFKIFMPVDEPKMPQGAAGAKGADVVFSVTQEILDKYKEYNIPKMFVNHGVLDRFIAKEDVWVNSKELNVGLSGNFLRPDIDWSCLMKIVENHSNVLFNFFGAFDAVNSNLSNTISDELIVVKEKLKSKKNVIIHGVVPNIKLSDELNKMDAFLICYDVAKDQSGGTNYHKVLEYMATGRVIVSNNITTYAKTNTPSLIEMPAEKNNSRLPDLFRKVIENVEYYNSADMFARRKEYASQHTYHRNILRMQDFINQSVLLR